jgi:hypothetical protein
MIVVRQSRGRGEGEGESERDGEGEGERTGVRTTRISVVQSILYKMGNEVHGCIRVTKKRRKKKRCTPNMKSRLQISLSDNAVLFKNTNRDEGMSEMHKLRE